MKPSIKIETLHASRDLIMKAVNPELSQLAQEDGMNFITNEASVLKRAAKHIVGVSRERELPLPVAPAHQWHEITPNAFRRFGINE